MYETHLSSASHLASHAVASSPAVHAISPPVKSWSGYVSYLARVGAEGPAEDPVGVGVGVSSSPPIIMTAAREEEQTIIIPTPATAMAAIVFYYTFRFF